MEISEGLLRAANQLICPEEGFTEASSSEEVIAEEGNDGSANPREDDAWNLLVAHAGHLRRRGLLTASQATAIEALARNKHPGLLSALRLALGLSRMIGHQEMEVSEALAKELANCLELQSSVAIEAEVWNGYLISARLGGRIVKGYIHHAKVSD